MKLRLYGLHKQAKLGPPTEQEIENPSKSRTSTYSGVATAHATQIVGTPALQRMASTRRDSGPGRNTEPSPAQQMEAWQSCADLSMEQAKKEFLVTLFTAVPYWKYEQFL